MKKLIFAVVAGALLVLAAAPVVSTSVTKTTNVAASVSTDSSVVNEPIKPTF